MWCNNAATVNLDNKNFLIQLGLSSKFSEKSPAVHWQMNSIQYENGSVEFWNASVKFCYNRTLQTCRGMRSLPMPFGRTEST